MFPGFFRFKINILFFDLDQGLKLYIIENVLYTEYSISNDLCRSGNSKSIVTFCKTTMFFSCKKERKMDI